MNNTHIIALILTLSVFQIHAIPHLTPDQARELGHKIWRNECGLSVDKLVWWNTGEKFASLGIGHFIWFPKNCTEPFSETFPALLTFMRTHGVTLPAWLTETTHCPWNTREEWLHAHADPRITELRTLLHNTIDIQTQFMIRQFDATRTAIIQAAAPAQRRTLERHFKRLEQTPQGLYALIDYTNFKGTGINERERYNNQGWGLLHVLSTMRESQARNDAVTEFAHAAQHLLTQRVHNAPPERNEQRWLPGWCNRLKTYVS